MNTGSRQQNQQQQPLLGNQNQGKNQQQQSLLGNQNKKQQQQPLLGMDFDDLGKHCTLKEMSTTGLLTVWM